MLLLATVGLAACTGTAVPDRAQVDEIAYRNFRTAVASVPDRQFQVYWLGREFTAGGAVFQGPYFVPIGGVANEGQLDIKYVGRGSLTISLYSEAAWQARAAQAPLPVGAIKKDATVNGMTGELYIIPAGTRPINALRLDLRLGDTWVLALAGSGGAATPGGPDVNPLIDEETFLSVMQQLRPYPD